MKERPSLPRLSAAMVVVGALALGTAAAHAGQGKAVTVRAAGLHGKAGHGFDFGRHGAFRPGHFKPKSVLTHRKRPNFARRRDHKRRAVFVPGYYFGYDRGYRYGYDPQPAPRYQADPDPAAASYRHPPVTPKWIHVSSLDDASDPGGSGQAYGDGGFGNNCLSVKTEITVDGRPMEAFGEACLSADGTWVLRPSQDMQ